MTDDAADAHGWKWEMKSPRNYSLDWIKNSDFSLQAETSRSS